MTFTEWLTKPAISRLQLVTIAIGVIMFLLTETSFFDELADIWKIAFYITLMVICASLGISFVDLKKIGNKVKDILSQRDFMTIEKELEEWTKLGMYVMNKLGRIWELFDKKQMKKKKKKNET